MTDQRTVEWQSSERHYTLTTATFTKRELRENELPKNNKTGLVAVPRWSRERLQNEAAALKYICSETTIPVPKFIDLSENDGLLCLRTARVCGISLDEVDEISSDVAVNRVNEYIESSVLPQLRGLRRNAIGSVETHLPLILPSRITYRDKRPSWNQRTSRNKDFVFCHNDLGQHNILVDPQTFAVTAIIDWEFAGFFPVSFEVPLWWCPWNKTTRDDEHVDKCIRWLDGHDDEEAKFTTIITGGP